MYVCNYKSWKSTESLRSKMSISSVTGVSGRGATQQATMNDLSRWANGPQIILSGSVETVESGPLSPPAPNATVTLPIPQPGLGEDYVVILTPINGEYAYVYDMDDDDLDDDDEDDHFVGFSIISDVECRVMYIVTKVGIRPR